MYAKIVWGSGIRPGPQTEMYLAKVLNRITLPGAVFIAFLALVPAIVIGLVLSDSDGNIGYNFGGTSLLIAVGVASKYGKSALVNDAIACPKVSAAAAIPIHQSSRAD